MVKKYSTKALRINLPVRGHKAGASVNIKVDKDGVPVDPYWRNRLKDAKVDNCVAFETKKKGGKVNAD